MKVILVRNGDADPNSEDIPLTEKGILQSKLVSKELSKYNIGKTYSSDLLRAKQTCEMFTKDFIEDKRLKEIYRVLIGGPIKEGTSKEREINDKKRADEIFNELLKNKRNVVVFCHGNIIRYFVKKVKKIEGVNQWKDMKIDNCSITIISNELEKLEVEEINKNDYLVQEGVVGYIKD